MKFKEGNSFSRDDWVMMVHQIVSIGSVRSVRSRDTKNYTAIAVKKTSSSSSRMKNGEQSRNQNQGAIKQRIEGYD